MNEPRTSSSIEARSTSAVSYVPARGRPTLSEHDASVQEELANPEIWENVKQRLAAKLSPSQYQNWIARTELGSLKSGELTIRVPDAATGEWIRDEYSVQIWEAIRELNASVSQIDYVVSNTSLAAQSQHT